MHRGEPGSTDTKERYILDQVSEARLRLSSLHLLLHELPIHRRKPPLQHITPAYRAERRDDADHERPAVRRRPRRLPHISARAVSLSSGQVSRRTKKNDHARAADVAELRDRVDERERDGALGGRARERVAQPAPQDGEAGVHLRHEEATCMRVSRWMGLIIV